MSITTQNRLGTPNIVKVDPTLFKKSCSQSISRAGYSSRTREDCEMRKGMTELYWLMYSSGVFGFNEFVHLSYQDVADLGWVSNATTAQLLLAGLTHKSYGGLLEIGATESGELGYKLSYNYMPKPRTTKKRVATQKANKAIARTQATATFSGVSGAQCGKIDAAIPSHNTKTELATTRHNAKKLLDVLCRNGIVSSRTFTKLPFKQLCANVIRLEPSILVRRGLGSVENTRTAMHLLVDAGVLESKQGAPKSAYAFKLVGDSALAATETTETVPVLTPEAQPVVVTTQDATALIEGVLAQLDTFRDGLLALLAQQQA